MPVFLKPADTISAKTFSTHLLQIGFESPWGFLGTKLPAFPGNTPTVPALTANNNSLTAIFTNIRHDVVL